jgi:hypothetical protein
MKLLDSRKCIVIVAGCRGDFYTSLRIMSNIDPYTSGVPFGAPCEGRDQASAVKLTQNYTLAYCISV